MEQKHFFAGGGACLFFFGLLLAGSGAARAQLPGDVFVPPYGDRGCWVLLFAGKEFDPPVAKLNGPTFIENFEEGPVVTPELEPVGGPTFLRAIQSAIVGPNARLMGFENVNYDKGTVTLDPGAQVPDLIELNFHERVDSLKVECVK